MGACDLDRVEWWNIIRVAKLFPSSWYKALLWCCGNNEMVQAEVTLIIYSAVNVVIKETFGFETVKEHLNGNHQP